MIDGPILLIEDNHKDEELAILALRKNKIRNEVIVAHDGEEALEYLFAQGARAGRDPDVDPELILLDLKLPKLNGFEVLRQLRANPRTKLLPVIIFTSSDEDKDRLAAYSGGANSFVRKPVDFTEFMEAIRQLGFYWLALNQPPPRDEAR